MDPSGDAVRAVVDVERGPGGRVGGLLVRPCVRGVPVVEGSDHLAVAVVHVEASGAGGRVPHGWDAASAMVQVEIQVLVQAMVADGIRAVGGWHSRPPGVRAFAVDEPQRR